jgi:hypothetical protein
MLNIITMMLTYADSRAWITGVEGSSLTRCLGHGKNGVKREPRWCTLSNQLNIMRWLDFYLRIEECHSWFARQGLMHATINWILHEKMIRFLYLRIEECSLDYLCAKVCLWPVSASVHNVTRALAFTMLRARNHLLRISLCTIKGRCPSIYVPQSCLTSSMIITPPIPSDDGHSLLQMGRNQRSEVAAPFYTLHIPWLSAGRGYETRFWLQNWLRTTGYMRRARNAFSVSFAWIWLLLGVPHGLRLCRFVRYAPRIV